MIKSARSGFVMQALAVTNRSKAGTFTDEGIRGYEELLSLAADNTVTLTFSDTSTLTLTLAVNTHIAFADVDTITSTGDVVIS